MDLLVSRAALDLLVEQAGLTAPEECCGILLGEAGVIDHAVPAANVADDRLRRFEIDHQALVDAHRAARSGGPRVVGYYHSHPVGPARPSATDRALAAHDGSIWAIVAPQGVTFWYDGEQGFVPLSYTVDDG